VGLGVGLGVGFIVGPAEGGDDAILSAEPEPESSNGADDVVVLDCVVLIVDVSVLVPGVVDELDTKSSPLPSSSDVVVEEVAVVSTGAVVVYVVEVDVEEVII
jgi:hypothetical protein